MSFSLHDAMMWAIVLLGAIVALYLIWGLVKASFKALFYLALLILFIALLKSYGLLPPEVSDWLDREKIIKSLRERIHGRESWKIWITPEGEKEQNQLPSEVEGEQVPSSDEGKSGT